MTEHTETHSKPTLMSKNPFNGDGESQGDVLDTGMVSNVTRGCGQGWMFTAGCSEPYLERLLTPEPMGGV